MSQCCKTMLYLYRYLYTALVFIDICQRAIAHKATLRAWYFFALHLQIQMSPALED